MNSTLGLNTAIDMTCTPVEVKIIVVSMVPPRQKHKKDPLY
jgi:hypothetical protein